MKVTVDANVLFSSIIKEGKTRAILFNPNLELVSPNFIVEEFLKYKEAIRKKFKGAPPDFDLLLKNVFAQLTLIDDKELLPYYSAAAHLLKDEKDWLYLACALKENTVIWSDDKGFKEQNRVTVYSTSEMINKFGTL